MNIEDVRKVFGAVAPAPAIAEQKNSLVPLILLITVVGVGFLVYTNNENRRQNAKRIKVKDKPFVL